MSEKETTKPENSAVASAAAKTQARSLFNRWLNLLDTNKFIEGEIKNIDQDLAYQYLNIEEETKCLVDEMINEAVKENSKLKLKSMKSSKLPLKPDWRLQVKSDSGISLGEDLVSQGDNKSVPAFYFPFGSFKSENSISNDWKTKAEVIFGGNELNEKQFVEVTKEIGLTRYLNSSLFKNSSKNAPKLNFKQFCEYFSGILEKHFTDESIAFAVLNQKESSSLLASDIQIAVEDVVYNHPGLSFLDSMAIFQARYGLIN